MIFPLSGFINPAITLARVDLPPPDSPQIPIISPDRTLKETFFKISNCFFLSSFTVTEYEMFSTLSRSIAQLFK